MITVDLIPELKNKFTNLIIAYFVLAIVQLYLYDTYVNKQRRTHGYIISLVISRVLALIYIILVCLLSLSLVKILLQPHLLTVLFPREVFSAALKRCPCSIFN